MTSRIRWATLLAAGLSVWSGILLAQPADGCRPAAGGLRAVVRDSAGIRIVENHFAPGVILPHWGIDSIPQLELAPPPDGTAGLARGISVPGDRLSDGRIVVAQGWPNPLLSVYDAQGKFLRTIAGRGHPNIETGSNLVVLPHAPGDTLALYLQSLRRLTYGTAEGRVLRTVYLPPAANGSIMAPVGILSDGSVIGIRRTETRVPMPGGTLVSPMPRGGRDTAYVQRLGRDGSSWMGSPRILPGNASFLHNPEAGTLVGSLPFAPGNNFAVGPDGYFHGDGDRYEVTRYLGGGQPDLVIRLCRSPVAVSPSDVQRYKDSVIARGMTPQSRRLRQELVNVLPYPEFHPAYLDLRADAEGRIWARGTAERDRSEWLVFSRDGVLAARATMPSTIMYLDAEYLLNGQQLYRLIVR